MQEIKNVKKNYYKQESIVRSRSLIKVNYGKGEVTK